VGVAAGGQKGEAEGGVADDGSEEAWTATSERRRDSRAEGCVRSCTLMIVSLDSSDLDRRQIAVVRWAEMALSWADVAPCGVLRQDRDDVAGKANRRCGSSATVRPRDQR
jgi:hypothetical protein